MGTVPADSTITADPPMKILVISNLYPPHEIGGYEIRCRDVCERLETFGHEIHVLTSDHKVAGRPDMPDPKVRRQLRIHGMYGHPWEPMLRLRHTERHNHEVLAKAIAEIQPDLIHIWNMGGISKSLLHTLEGVGIPLVYDISDHWVARSIKSDVWLLWWNAPAQPFRQLLRKFLTLSGIRRRIDRTMPTHSWDDLRFRNIYFSSAFMRDATVAKGWPVGHAAVIHCGIDTASFQPKTDHSGFGKLLWVGRIDEDKDPITAIRALSAAHRLGLNHLTLDIYGKGDAAYLRLVQAEVAALALGGHVRFLLAPPEEMRSLYTRYDALLFTSNWGEPFGLTPLEAMASALPVITTTDGGQKELARDGINSLIANAADPESFAMRIHQLAASEPLRAFLASTAFDEVRNSFDLDPITRKIEAFLLSAARS
jgi:glycosyltransferase involved in cell wall biosynthesis